MNDTIHLLTRHRSERSFQTRSVDEELLSAIIQTAHKAPSAFNAQHISSVVVRAPETRQRIAELAGGQPWIATAPVFITLIVDFHKTAQGVARAGAEQHIHRCLEGMLAAATDAGIILSTMMTAARSLGLGVVPVSGIRANASAMIELLQLPEKTFALCGMALGYVLHPAAQKPRLPISSFRHDERYDPHAIDSAIGEHDQAMLAHWQRQQRPQPQNWSSSVGQRYAHNYRPQLRNQLRANGLDIE